MLYEKTLYKADIQYLVDVPIFEYDISKANISVLSDKGVISEDQYQYLYNLPKLERNIAIGNMCGSDSNITTILKEGIMEARKFFLEQNDYKDEDILAIRNDAITVIGREAKYRAAGNRVIFRLAGKYTSFYSTPNMDMRNINSKINGVDFFYYIDPVSGQECLDTKGLGDAEVLHKNFMLDFLAELFYTIQLNGIEMSINLLKSFYLNYINKALPIEYYRELNSRSLYKLNSDLSMTSALYTDIVIDKKFIDIGYNENLLRFFNRILSSIYFRK